MNVLLHPDFPTSPLQSLRAPAVPGGVAIPWGAVVSAFRAGSWLEGLATYPAGSHRLAGRSPSRGHGPAISALIATESVYLCGLGDCHVAGKALLAMTPYGLFQKASPLQSLRAPAVPGGVAIPWGAEVQASRACSWPEGLATSPAGPDRLAGRSPSRGHGPPIGAGICTEGLYLCGLGDCPVAGKTLLAMTLGSGLQEAVCPVV
jgi:hypothetical protein